MAVTARISKIWSRQKLFVAIFFIAFSLWFYVDGALRYPKSNAIWDEHHRFDKENRLNEWPDYTRQRGWLVTPPHKRYTTGDIIGQYVFGGLGTAGGLLLLTYWLTQRKRMLEMDEATITTPSGTRVPFDSIRGLGKKRWESKGIATVRYEDNGRLLQFIVDDYKYDTEPARQIVDYIEQHLVAKSEAATVSPTEPQSEQAAL